MAPGAVTTIPASGRRSRLSWVAIQPLRDVESVELLAPQQPSEGLTLHEPHIVIVDVGLQRRIECVGLKPALMEQAVESLEVWCISAVGAQPDTHRRALAGRHHA